MLDRGCAFGALARALWLGGYPDQAAQAARTYLEEAGATDHPIVLCIALVDTASVFVWNGDLGYAARIVDQLLTRADEHALEPYRAIGLGWKGEVEHRRGDLESGITLMRDGLEQLGVDRRQLLGLIFSTHLAEALAATGDFEPALTLIDDALTEAETRGASYRLPEMLRIKAEILSSMPQGNAGEVDDCLRRSLDLARRQSAVSWELRTSTSLARLHAKRGRGGQARAALASVYERFTEGFATADLRKARQLLDDGAGRRVHGDGR
jgi:predicted ATPase